MLDTFANASNQNAKYLINFLPIFCQLIALTGQSILYTTILCPFPKYCNRFKFCFLLLFNIAINTLIYIPSNIYILIIGAFRDCGEQRRLKTAIT